MTPSLGVCYYPEHWPQTIWAADAAAMVDAGLSWVRIGEFAWSRIEPREGDFNWGWLDKAIEILGDAGLKIVLGTPTATPPRWMLTKRPNMLASDENGRPRKFGSRRQYCFSHEGYKWECARIAYNSLIQPGCQNGVSRVAARKISIHRASKHILGKCVLVHGIWKL